MMAADLVGRQVSVIAAPGTLPARVAKAATRTIPIVFGVSGDPVKLGLVASLARPGGNATGVNFFGSEVNAKRLGLLRELVPTAARIAVLVNPANTTNTSSMLADVEPAARALGLQIQIYNARTSSEIDAAFAALLREQHDALFLASDGLFSTRRVQLISLAARHALPASYASREFVEAGGLLSYGTSLLEMYRQVGVYTGHILKGATPAGRLSDQLRQLLRNSNAPSVSARVFERRVRVGRCMRSDRLFPAFNSRCLGNNGGQSCDTSPKAPPRST